MGADTETGLVAAAIDAMARAYAPYSRFPVGAAIRDETGAVHIGANVENAAYPVGNCAEASAIAAMVMAGGTGLPKSRWQVVTVICCARPAAPAGSESASSAGRTRRCLCVGRMG